MILNKQIKGVDFAKRYRGGKIKSALLALVISALSFGCQHLDNTSATGDGEITGARLKGSALGDQITRPALSSTDTSPLDVAEETGPVKEQASQLTDVPVLSESGTGNQFGGSSKAPRPQAENVEAYVRPLPIPDFIDVVFGEILGVPFVTGPEIVARQDVVQLRSSGEIPAKEFLSLVTTALEDYGLRVVPENGIYRIVEDKVLRARIPKFIKSRAHLRTRSDLRPVVQFVEMNAIDSAYMVEFLEQAFGRNNAKISIAANRLFNYVVLTGLPEDVNAALTIIHQLDELKYAGSQVQRYTPRYWKVRDLVKELSNALTVEGWPVSISSNQARTIFLMPVDFSNDLFIFTRTQAASDRVNHWIKALDKSISSGDTEQIFVYQVKNVDAVLLVETLNSVLASQGGGGVPAVAPTGESSGLQSGVFTVDPLGNRIVFSGTSNDYDKFIRLLEQLDTPTPEVLIEVQIAEITLTDNISSGLQLVLDDLDNGSVTDINTLTTGSTGFTAQALTDNVNATLTALATNRRVKFLSAPVLTSRSGGSASIQVGTDVPVITSQRPADTQSGGGTTDILQNVEYRSTGVLMTIEPIVFSNDRIDLTVSQEVSATVDSADSTVSSPTISNRTITTQLSLQDGATVVLGGLIQENQVRSDNGVPFLKDIPAIGSAFSSKSTSVDRTELVVLITAYILRGQEDKSRFVDYFSDRIDGLIADDKRLVTLKPKHF